MSSCYVSRGRGYSGPDVIMLCQQRAWLQWSVISAVIVVRGHSFPQGFSKMGWDDLPVLPGIIIFHSVVDYHHLVIHGNVVGTSWTSVC